MYAHPSHLASMDLLATVRKEGSRGGRGEVDWSAVQNSSHREHYLGHSLHAPVGRWAKGRDLQWYARADSDDADGEDPAAKAARERKEEIRRVKEAEEDALARALGLPVPDRNNANLQPVSDKREVDKVLNEATGMDEGVGKGIGYGSHAASGQAVMGERIEGNAEGQDRELQYALREYRRQNRDRRDRSRSRDREHRHHHRRQKDISRDRRHDRPREKRRERSRDRHRDRSRDRRQEHRSRSRSPEHRLERRIRRRSRSRSR